MSSVFFLSFSISETKHVIKKLTTQVTVTSEVLIKKSINIHCCFPINNLYIDYFLIPTLKNTNYSTGNTFRLLLKYTLEKLIMKI